MNDFYSNEKNVKSQRTLPKLASNHDLLVKLMRKQLPSNECSKTGALGIKHNVQLRKLLEFHFSP